MSVKLIDDRIVLAGDCPVEDAENLLRLIQENPERTIDINDLGRIHMAVMQVMLAARAPVTGVPENAFVREWMLPHLLGSAA